MRKASLSWLAGALLLLFTSTACRDGEPQARVSPSPVPAECGADDGPGNVISSIEVEVLEEGQAKATYVLTRDAEVGILISRREDSTAELQFVGRVPFGPQRSTVVNEEVFDLPMSEGQPVDAGEYEFTLRAFEAGRLNQGDPIDTRSACVTIE